MASEPTQLDRIEGKLDALLAALADNADEGEGDTPMLTLDGDACGGERDQAQGLG